jgi:GR25 family glycosyltransferase involved in LPS biosynthesis
MDVYCLCLPERKEHTELFFKTLDMTPIYSNIETISHLKQNIVNLISNNIIEDSYEIKDKSFYGKIACSLSHINALKLFLESGKSTALIFEDDNHIPSHLETIEIKNRLNHTIEQLSTLNSWYFCNLSPCNTNRQTITQITENLYAGSIGYCMNAYFITQKGAMFLINRLPLSNKCHTLDICLPEYGVNYPFQMLEVHPRIFRQKDGHQDDTTLGNKYSSSLCIPEYNNNNNNIYMILFFIIIILIIYMIRSINPRKYTISLIISIFTSIFTSILYIKYMSKRTEYLLKIDWNNRAEYLLKIAKYKKVIYDNLYTENNGYRLADMILYREWRTKENGEKYHLEFFPNSIASEYMKQTQTEGNYELLFSILKKHTKQFNEIDLPKNNTLIIHLRLGDVIEMSKPTVKDFLIDNKTIDSSLICDKNYGNVVYNINENTINNSVSYVKPLSYFYNKIHKINGINEIVLVAGCHVPLSYEKSYLYIKCIQIFFEELGYKVSTRLGKNPDEDFIFMSNAKYFLPSGGGFSNIVKNMVKKNKNVIL